MNTFLVTQSATPGQFTSYFWQWYNQTTQEKHNLFDEKSQDYRNSFFDQIDPKIKITPGFYEHKRRLTNLFISDFVFASLSLASIDMRHQDTTYNMLEFNHPDQEFDYATFDIIFSPEVDDLVSYEEVRIRKAGHNPD